MLAQAGSPLVCTPAAACAAEGAGAGSGGAGWLVACGSLPKLTRAGLTAFLARLLVWPLAGTWPVRHKWLVTDVRAGAVMRMPLLVLRLLLVLPGLACQQAPELWSLRKLCKY